MSGQPVPERHGLISEDRANPRATGRRYTRAMIEARHIEALAERLSAALPPGLASLRHELRDNFRVLLRAHLEKLDLVSRERFEVQAELLARTQSRLKALETRLAALEQRQAER